MEHEKQEALRAYARGKTYHIYRYGCWMNDHDAEHCAGLLESLGFSPADAGAADLLLFNSCCVCREAELQAEADLRAPFVRDKLVILRGCLPQQQGRAQQLKAQYPFVDIVCGTGSLDALLEDLYRAAVEGKGSVTELSPEPPREDSPIRRASRFSAYVSIISGCDNHCSYCIVPSVRGRAKSRRSEDILRELRTLKAQGYQEVTLVGQNVLAFGAQEGISFPELLRRAAETGLERIRFLTSHPRDVTTELLDVMADTPAVEKHLHLPVQSGSDAILRAMGRGYTRSDSLRIVDAFYARMPDGCLTTDIIAGFPGETEQDFADTLSLYEDARFTFSYLFTYSPREGTAAAVMPGQLDETEKRRRLAVLTALRSKTAASRFQDFEGMVERVLAEEAVTPGMMRGKTASGIPVHFSGGPELEGRFMDVQLLSSSGEQMTGALF